MFRDQPCRKYHRKWISMQDLPVKSLKLIRIISNYFRALLIYITNILILRLFIYIIAALVVSQKPTLMLRLEMNAT